MILQRVLRKRYPLFFVERFLIHVSIHVISLYLYAYNNEYRKLNHSYLKENENIKIDRNGTCCRDAWFQPKQLRQR